MELALYYWNGNREKQDERRIDIGDINTVASIIMSVSIFDVDDGLYEDAVIIYKDGRIQNFYAIQFPDEFHHIYPVYSSTINLLNNPAFLNRDETFFSKYSDEGIYEKLVKLPNPWGDVPPWETYI